MMKSDDLIQLISRRYDRFVERIQHSDPNAAAEEFAKFCHMLRRTDLKIPMRVLTSFMEAWLEMFWQCRRHDLMLKAAEDAQTMFGPDPEWAFARGEALFNLGRFPESEAVLTELTIEEFEEPMLFFLLACLAERRGDDSNAERLFQTANRLEPKSFPVPVPMSEEEVHALFQRIVAEMPDPIVWNVKQVPIFIDAFPSDALIKSFDEPFDPLAMGVFMGEPRGTESPWPTDQPRIILFHKNIAKACGDFETLEEELRKTLFHEIGHFLGFDEDQLEDMGLA